MYRHQLRAPPRISYYYLKIMEHIIHLDYKDKIRRLYRRGLRDLVVLIESEMAS